MDELVYGPDIRRRSSELVEFEPREEDVDNRVPLAQRALLWFCMLLSVRCNSRDTL